MYAVVKVAGFQYRVEKDQVLRVPRLSAGEGESITLDDVLLVHDGTSLKVGNPVVEGASVSAQVVEHGRGRKIVAGKFKRRIKYRRHWGHRQDYTEIKIADIHV